MNLLYSNRILKKVFSTLLLFIICGILNCGGQEILEECTLMSNGSPGTCKPLNECIVVRQEIKSGNRNYTLCKRRGMVSYVCCPLPVMDITDRTGETNSMRIADIKCKEYAEAVFEKRISNVMLPGPHNYIQYDTCGAKSIPLIVGGELAAPREFPHMALIGYFNKETDKKDWMCGGTLISERFVLTAAHCTDSSDGKPKYIRLGELNVDLHHDHDDPEDFDIAEIIPHPSYNKSSLYNDIALIKLDRDVEINRYKRPACLAKQKESNTKKAIATGWGLTSWAGEKSSFLQKVTLEKFEETYCQAVYHQFRTDYSLNNKVIDYDIQICAGSKTETRDTCQGDSGGPLQIFANEYCMYEIIGITSRGIICGRKGVPGIYTRVFPYISWIEDIVWKAPKFLENQPCTINITNQKGECKFLQNCPIVFHAVRKGKLDFTRCPIESKKLIVCCPVKNVAPEPSPIPATIEDQNQLRIHQKKCHEYQDAVYDRTHSVSLLPGSRPNKIDRCGFKTVELIIGGTDAKTREFPHMALLGFTNGNEIRWECGGSLISERFILTAAHCMKTRLRDPKIIRVGDLNINSNDDEADPVDIKIEQIFLHPNYKPKFRNHDIALIKLSKNVIIDTYKRPACLPTLPDPKSDKAIASGWGYNDSINTEGVDHLQKVTLEKFSEDECKKIYSMESGLNRAYEISYKRQICVGSRNSTKDTCQGDSGGPLQILHSKEYCMWEIIGITSFGAGCGTPEIPGVYTRVYNYIDWIESIVWS
ncbi:transmembrane protease serine 9-like [Condylostylus longicornis]|uniref:transmembrane protease serine 9-like n=1 Tax=Condylostylus longicornis TaxID=2530218 RepID=UPI00244DE2EF|nr:transmembrane protease serine 9-like [Condylostylus longicornis]